MPRFNVREIPASVDVSTSSHQVYDDATKKLIATAGRTPTDWITYFREQQAQLAQLDRTAVARLSQQAQAAVYIVGRRPRHGPVMRALLDTFREHLEAMRAVAPPEFKAVHLKTVIPYGTIQERVRRSLRLANARTDAVTRLRHIAFAALMCLENGGVPRRNEYLSLVAVRRASDDTDPTANTYNVRSHRVTLRSYKSVSVYGPYTFVVQRVLLRRILARLSREPSMFASIHNADAFRAAASTVCSSSLLRKLCVTERFGSEDAALSTPDALELSKRMGHSVQTQQRDYRHASAQLPAAIPAVVERPWWNAEMVAELYHLATTYGTDVSVWKAHCSPEFLLLDRSNNRVRVKMQNEHARLRGLGIEPNPFADVPLRASQLLTL